MANLSVEEPDALMCARPGLWEPWRATARATRPEWAWGEQEDDAAWATEARPTDGRRQFGASSRSHDDRASPKACV